MPTVGEGLERSVGWCGYGVGGGAVLISSYVELVIYLVLASFASGKVRTRSRNYRKNVNRSINRD